jgi:hypothetical protein
MRAVEIEELLFNDVRQNWGHELFTANSALDFVDLIRTAAKKMVAQRRTGAEDLEKARANLRRFVGEMEVVKDENGWKEFREQTVSEALRRLCPLWPFCE